MQHKFKKNFIYNFISDLSGQGTIRNVWPFSTINSIYGPGSQLINNWQHLFIKDPMALNLCRTLYFQRQMNPNQLPHIEEYKHNQPHFGYRMVWDMDDMIWGLNEKQGGDKYSGIPTYNGSWVNISKDVKDASIKIMNLMDELSFSTKHLADYVKNHLGVNVPSTIIPNTVPMAYWGEKRIEPVTEKIKKPIVLYTGSPTHYNNAEKLKGDWDNSWTDWVIKSVKNNEIDFVCMGGLPFVLDEIKDKIRIYPWVQIFKMHLIIKEIQPHFCINPLVPNEFNYSKSDLKRVESAAAGMVCAGTVFTNNKPSPYDECGMQAPDNIDVKGIDDLFDKFTEPDNFNDEIKRQYDWMYDDGRYTELPKNINRLLNFVLGK